MKLNRKEFLIHLTALFARPSLIASPTPTRSGGACLSVTVPPEPEPWLKDWLAARRIPIVASVDPVEASFVQAIRSNASIGFTYLGGTHPGEPRRIRPVMLCRIEGYPSAYVLGLCETVGQVRTFRLDRVLLPPRSEASPG